MAHTHGPECERLHDTLEGLIAQLDTSPLGAPLGALPDGSILPPFAPDASTLTPDLPPIAAQPSSGPNQAELDQQIEDVRQALADMGCDRKAA